jgi:hypothetical protein
VALWAWIFQRLLAYAFRRYNLIKTLVIDLGYRAACALWGYHCLEVWHTDFKNKSLSYLRGIRELPLLIPIEEKHLLYETVQSELVECLWGKEVFAVRQAYQQLDLIERRVEIIRTLYNELIDKRHDFARDLSLRGWLADTKNSINLHLSRYQQHLTNLLGSQILKAKLDVLQTKAASETDLINKSMKEVTDGMNLIEDLKKKYTDDLFLCVWVAYPLQVGVPLVLTVLWTRAFVPDLPMFKCISEFTEPVYILGMSILTAICYWCFRATHLKSHIRENL